jgi:hypothetical protein
MPCSTKLGSRITDDIDDGYGWYEDEQEGLGERFLAAIRNKIKTIELNPEAFGSRANKKFRRRHSIISSTLLYIALTKRIALSTSPLSITLINIHAVNTKNNWDGLRIALQYIIE